MHVPSNKFPPGCKPCSGNRLCFQFDKHFGREEKIMPSFIHFDVRQALACGLTAVISILAVAEMTTPH
jgi:hypothetical protein